MKVKVDNEIVTVISILSVTSKIYLALQTTTTTTMTAALASQTVAIVNININKQKYPESFIKRTTYTSQGEI